MTRHTSRPTTGPPRADEPASAQLSADLAGTAARLAAELRALVPSCTTAIAVELGARWQLLAQTGGVDVASDWRGTLAASAAGGDGSRRGDGYSVAVLPTVGPRALVMLVAETDLGVPVRALETLAPLLGDAARRLDVARAAQRHERAARRIELLSRLQPAVRPSRVTDELEVTVASLWPEATVSFYDLGANRTAPSALRRLAQAAHDLDHPVADDAPGARRLLPPDLGYRVAIPFRSRRGALIVEVAACGEELDGESVAVGHALARAAELRDREHALTTEIRTLRREDPETGCAPGDVLSVRLEQALQESTRGDVALLLVELDPASAQHELERAAIVGEALADAVRRERAEIFRVQSWQFAIVLVATDARASRLVAQRLQLAVRHAGADGIGCSASIGVALAPVNGAEASELIDAAEQAMQTTAAIAGELSLATTRGRRSARPSDVFRRVDALRTFKRLADESFHGGRSHADAIATRAVRIAQAMHLSSDQVQAIQLAGELSEIGSLLIRDGVLHPSLPAVPLGPDPVAATLTERLLHACGFAAAAEISANLHEHYDGSGTPHAFMGDAIPIGARVVAVARDMESTLEGRPLDSEALARACERIEAGSSRAFDPYVVQVAIRTAEPHRAGRVPLTE